MIRAVWRKELAVTWSTPVPYAVGALFQAVLGLLFVDQLQGRAQALVQPLFPLAGFLLLVTVPILTMRSVAEEARSGTLDLLLAIPVPVGRLVLGKWLAATTTITAVVAPAAAYAALVGLYGDPDRGPVIAGFAGLFLLVAALAALGICASAVSSSQPVAAMVTFVVAALLWFSDTADTTISTGGLLSHFSLSERLRSFAGGAVETGDVGFLVALTLALVGFGVALVASRPRPAARAPGARPAVAIAAAALVAAGLIDFGADRTSRIVDLTAERSLSLTTQTQRLAAAVTRPTDVTVFLHPDDPGRAQAGALLLRYSRLNRRIRYRILDPQQSAGEQRRLGVDPALGGVAVAQGDSVEVVASVTEQDITGALARLARGRTANVCFATGHGEASLADDGPEGMTAAVALLQENGYRVRELDLLIAPAVPTDCDGVVLVNPRSDLGGSAEVLRRWLAEDDGRLLVLTDPSSTVVVDGVLSDHRLGVRRGIVLEGDPEAVLPQDPTAPIVRTYSSANPIVRRLAPTYFPGVQQVVVGESAPADGLTTNRLADTSPLSYLESEPLNAEFDPAADVAGPITVAGAADRSRLEGDQVHRSRVVVVGDSDFASNALIGQAGNSTLFVRALDWLTLDDQLVVLSANIPEFRPLVLTEARLRYARFVSLAFLPGLFLVAGLLVWALRRSR